MNAKKFHSDEAVRIVHDVALAEMSSGAIVVDPHVIATKACDQIDPQHISRDGILHLAMITARQIASQILRAQQKNGEDEHPQERLWGDCIQARYPVERDGAELYVLADYMHRPEIVENMARMEKEIQTKTEHLRALRAYLKDKDDGGWFDPFGRPKNHPDFGSEAA